jgi:predicted DNA-binding protein
MSDLTIHLPEAIQRRLSQAVERAHCSEAEWVVEAVTWALEYDDDDPLVLATRTTNRLRSGRTCRQAF